MISTQAWIITIVGLALVILFDLGLAIVRRNKKTSLLEASFWTIFYIAGAIVFGVLLPGWSTE